MFFELLRVGLGAIRAHKFRAALTVLSITIGAFSIVLMSSLARSGIATLTRGVEDVGGARMVVFFPRAPERAERKRSSYTRGLTATDAGHLRLRVPHVDRVEIHAHMGPREARVAGAASAAPAPRRVDLVGGGPDFLGAFGIKLAVGRNLDLEDLRARARVAVIGQGAAQALFPSPEAALGQIVRLDMDSYRVIGVAQRVKRFGVRFGFDWNDFAVTPITSASSAAPAVVLLLTDDVRNNDLVKRIAVGILRDRHHGVDDFEAFDFGEVVEKFGEVFRIMQLIVGFISGLALVVGGIGVMNILLVSVSERVREIGVRKAVGAADTAISAQFLFESVLLSALGGLAGAAAGVAAAVAAGRIIGAREEAWVPLVAGEAVAGSLLVSMLVGVVFGLVPARRAGRLQVVDCLRAAG
jgi:putative ABC transport system permease protein